MQAQTQTQTGSKHILNELRHRVTGQDTIYIVRVNHAIQVSIKRPGQAAKNITVGLAKAFGYSLMPNGLWCSEWQIIEDLALNLPQISQPSGLLNIELR